MIWISFKWTTGIVRLLTSVDNRPTPYSDSTTHFHWFLWCQNHSVIFRMQYDSRNFYWSPWFLLILHYPISIRKWPYFTESSVISSEISKALLTRWFVATLKVKFRVCVNLRIFVKLSGLCSERAPWYMNFIQNFAAKNFYNHSLWNGLPDNHRSHVNNLDSRNSPVNSRVESEIHLVRRFIFESLNQRVNLQVILVDSNDSSDSFDCRNQPEIFRIIPLVFEL